MVRQAHHPEPSRRVNLKFQSSMTKTDWESEQAIRTTISLTAVAIFITIYRLVILDFGHCKLFDICDLQFQQVMDKNLLNVS